MSNIFGLCPTHFSRGAKKFLRGLRPPCTPLVTDLYTNSTLNKSQSTLALQCPVRIEKLSQSSNCSIFKRLLGSPSFINCEVLVSQYSFQSLQCIESSDKFLGRFLDLFSKSIMSLSILIPEYEKV